MKDGGITKINETMKKMFFMLIMFVAAFAASTSAQLVYDYTASTVTLSNGYVYAVADIPGAAYARPGDNLMTVVNNYFMRLRHSNMEEYNRQYTLFMMKGGMAGVQPIGTATINGMVGGMAVGGGMVGGAVMGTGMNNSGMVYGTGGMAGATSNVNITNGNMVSTIGSGVTAVYDSNTKTINVSGDPLMALGRVGSAIYGGIQTAKANKAAKRAAQQGQQQVQIIYVDSATGQVLSAQPVQTQPQQVQTVQQVQTRTVQQAQPVQAQPVQATNGQVVNLYNGL